MTFRYKYLKKFYDALMNRSTKKKGSKILLLINTLLSNYDIGTNFIKIAYLKA